MNCRIADLRNKDVINVRDGICLGYVSDVEVDTCTARVCAIIIYGKSRCFGLLGRDDDCVISWEEIEMIGKDTILVNCNEPPCRRKRTSIIDSLFGYN